MPATPCRASASLREPPRLHFIDNLDAHTLRTLLARLPHATTRFVAISKSGGTAETLMQTIAALSALKDAGLQTRIPDLFLGISEPAKSGKKNGLRDLLGKFRVPMLDHDPGVGGRYSALTNVGLLPAAMLGLDVAAIREGAGARACARCWRKNRRRRCRPRSVRRLSSRSRRARANRSAC